MFRFDELEDVYVVIDGRPRRKRDKRRSHRDTGAAQNQKRFEDIVSRVTLVQMFEHDIAQRFNRGHDEDAAVTSKILDQSAVLDDVLDLCCEIKGEIGELFMHRSCDLKRMARAVQKIGIPESDVPRSRSHEPLHIIKHNFSWNYEEAPVVNRWNRTMCAEMQTPAAGFDVADKVLLAVVV